MDLRLSYINANPDVLDILQNAKFALEGVAKIAEAVLGTSTVVDGFPCTPTSPASLNVNVGAGQVYQQQALVAQPISSLQSDSHLVMKSGLLRDALALTFVPPTTPGYAQNVLIQVQYADDDNSSTQVFNYYNAANPDVPLTGPGGNNQAQTLFHKGVAQVTTKYGVAATAGSQVTPSPDAGFVGLYVVTLAYGQSAITVGNIALYANAPFIGIKLPAIPPWVRSGQVQQSVSSATYYVRTDGNDSNTGTSNTPTGAFATIAGALAATSNIVTTTGDLIFQLGVPGTYAAPTTINRGTSIRIAGDPNNQGNYLISGSGSTSGGSTVITVSGGIVTFSGVRLQNTGALNHTLLSTSNAIVRLQYVTSSCTASNNPNAHIVASDGGYVSVGIGCICDSSMGYLMYALGGSIVIPGVAYTLQNTPAFSSSTIFASVAGRVQLPSGTSFTGTGATGTRYTSILNGVINTFGGGANFIPGNAAGSTASGGQYA